MHIPENIIFWLYDRVITKIKFKTRNTPNGIVEGFFKKSTER